MVKYIAYPYFPTSFDTLICSVYSSGQLYYTDRSALEKELTDFALKELKKAKVDAVGLLPTMRGKGGIDEGILTSILLNVKAMFAAGKYIQGLLFGWRLIYDHIQQFMALDLDKNRQMVNISLSIRSEQPLNDETVYSLGGRLLEMEVLAEFILRQLQASYPAYAYDRRVSAWIGGEVQYDIQAITKAYESTQFVVRLRQALRVQKPQHNTRVTLTSSKFGLLTWTITTGNKTRTYFTFLSRRIVGAFAPQKTAVRIETHKGDDMRSWPRHLTLKRQRRSNVKVQNRPTK